MIKRSCVRVKAFLKHMGAFLSNRLVDRDGLSLFPGLRRESGGNVMQQQSSVRAVSLPRRLHIPIPHPEGVLFPGVADGSGGSASGFRHPLRTGPAGFGAWQQFVALFLRLRAFYRFHAVWGRNSGARFTARQSPCYNLTKAREERFGKRCRIGRIRNFWRRPWRRWNRAFFSWRRATP